MKKFLKIFFLLFFIFYTKNDYFYLKNKYKWLNIEIYNNIKKYCILPPYIVLALIQIESNGNPKAIGPLKKVILLRNNKYIYEYHRAIGLMQVMSFYNDNLFDLETNIQYGCKILNECLNKKTYISLALSCYHNGINNVQFNKEYVNKIFGTILYNGVF